MTGNMRIHRRLCFLIGGLLCVAAALPLSRRMRTPSPAPAATASLDVQRRYWRQRVADNVTDIPAYVRAGALEERAGYYMAAVKYLSAARALGAPDSDLCAPLGRAFTHLAQDDKALSEMEKAVRIAPDDPEPTINLAGLYVNANQQAEAVNVLRRFEAAHPSLDASVLRRFAFCFLECEDNRSAGAFAERVLAIDPTDLISHSIAARCALAEKDLPTARRHFETMLAQVPNDALTLYLYGTVLDAQGEHDQALLEWERAIALNPNAPDIYERIGDAYRKRGDFGHAAVAYEQLAQRVPTGLNADRAATALTRANKPDRAAYWGAVAAGFAGNLSLALQDAQKAAASSDPATHRHGLQAMAEVYRGRHQREPYLATMRKLTAGGDVDDLVLMAQAWAELDEHAKRTECLQAALQRATPDRQSAIRYDMAVIYRTRGMYDDAEQTLKEAVATDKKNPALYRLLAEINYSRRGLPGRLDAAIAGWQSAIALDPEEASDWQHLGVAYEAADQPAKALPYLEHAADLEPGSGPAYQELSKVYSRMGDRPTSQRMMETYARYVAFDQQRQTLRTRAHREHATVEDLVAYGDLAVKMDDLDEASQQYARALQQRPSDAALRRKLEDIYIRLRMTDQLAQVNAVPGGKS